MEIREPAGRQSAGARPQPWGAIVLLGLVLLLFSISTIRGRTGAIRDQGESARFAVENLLHARQVYLLLHSPHSNGAALESEKAQLISGHLEAAVEDPSPPTIRKLALCQKMVGDSRWSTSLRRLATSPVAMSAASVERELALWRVVFTGSPSAAQIAEFERSVKAMDLGWYAHIALEIAYAQAGRTADAREEARLANRSSARLVLLGLLGAIAGLIGLGICALVASRALSSTKRYRPPITMLDRVLTLRAPWPFVPAQRTLLYFLFLSYLASMAILRIALSWLGLGSAFSNLAYHRPVEALALSTLLSLVPLVPPLALYLVLARRAYISPRALGFCTASWRIDVLCGVAGYLAGIPLVYVARVFSERLFHGIETPLNPAITAFAGSASALYQMLIFVQAALLAPLVEEALFRGLFFQSLEERQGRWGAALLSSGVFALLHPQLPLGFLGIFALGMVFDGLFIMRRSLLPAIVAHAINNGLILFFLLTLIRS